MPAWLGALVGVPALLVAAKAHGRQVRLEREAAGYHQVEFGGTNPAFVEALWRRDRYRFWPFVALAAPSLAALGWWLDGVALAAVGGLLWAPIAGFHLAGLLGFVKQKGRGGFAWWSAAIALGVAAVLTSLV